VIFEKTKLDGVFLIRPEQIVDERGFFARTYCVRESEQHGIDPQVVQRSISYNRRRGTLRGMHFQIAPHEESKMVSCTQGAIYDVVLDMRIDSATHRQWVAATLTAEESNMLFIPKGCAHGFITLTDDAIVRYDISDFYHPESARGVRYDDPAFGIEWPFEPVVVAERDLSFEKYRSGPAP
jgi:dTDP-4-dehydrorhamnose 3,5-epimerase